MKSLQENIEEEYQKTLRYASDLEQWYLREKNAKKIWSKTFRFISIALIGLAGIFPLVKNIQGTDISDIGYINVALAGTLLLLDRFFGFSSSWIRYILTSIELRRVVYEFKIKWQTENVRLLNLENIGSQEALALYGLISDMRMKLNEIEKQETLSWATEFQTNLAELQKLVNAKTDSLKPGAIKIDVKNYKEFKEIVVTLDNLTAKEISGAYALFSDVAIGPHEILVKAKNKESTIEVSANVIVEVDPNKLCSAEVML